MRTMVRAFLPVLLLWVGGCPGLGELTGEVRPALKNGVPGFDIGAVVLESYWYSRYDLGSLVMKSGLGETFMPDMMMVGAMVDMVSDTESSATPPSNAALLRRVFNEGDPMWINPGDGDPLDFGDERWAPASDTSTSAAASGWTMMKELEWVKQFHVDSHFGSPGAGDGIPGAQQRFGGLVLYVEAMMQGAEWINNPAAFDTSDLGGKYVMLEAMSDLADVTAQPTLPSSVSNRARAVADMMAPSMGMADADALAEMFFSEADRLFDTLGMPSNVEDLSLAIQGLTWYASIRETNRAAAIDRIVEFADALLAEPKRGPVDHARAIRGLLEAHRVTGNDVYLDAAESSFDALMDDFDWEYGVFTSQSTYTADEIAWLVGALQSFRVNSFRVNGDPSRRDDATDLAEHFFEAAVNMSGFQISAPPIEALPEYERLAEINHRYPTTPVPPAAGGANGIAPVFAASATWDADSKTWTVDKTSYDTGGAMHLSNEMLWSFGEVDGFPDVPDGTSSTDDMEPPVVGTEPPAGEGISFAAQIQPIFDARCVSCHAPGGIADTILRLNAGESLAALVNQSSVQNPAWTRVVPGNSGVSLLFLKVSLDEPPVGDCMPLGTCNLSDADIALIRDWIDEGARDN